LANPGPTTFDVDAAVKALGSLAAHGAGPAANDSAETSAQGGGGEPSAALAASLETLRSIRPLPAEEAAAGLLAEADQDKAALPATAAADTTGAVSGTEASAGDATPADRIRAMDEMAWRRVKPAASDPPSAVIGTEDIIPIKDKKARSRSGNGSAIAETPAFASRLVEQPPAAVGAVELNGSAAVEVTSPSALVSEPVLSSGENETPLNGAVLTEPAVPVGAVAVDNAGPLLPETSGIAAEAADTQPEARPPLVADEPATAVVADAALTEAPAVNGSAIHTFDRAPIPAVEEKPREGELAKSLPVPDRASARPAEAKARLSPLAGILIGAAAGAMAATVAAAVLLPRVLQSIDLRVTPVSERLALVENRMQQTDSAIGRLNNEIAQAIDGSSGVADKVSAQSEELAKIQRDLAARPAPSIASLDPSVFTVAVVQLRSAFYSGRPFEAELINVFTLARGDDHFTGPLNVLSGPARTGVQTAAQFRDMLPAFAKVAGLRIGAPQSYYDYGLALFSEYVGFTTDSYAVESGNQIVTAAYRRLMSGDVAGAVDTLNGLDRSLLPTFQPWLEVARVYVREEAAVSTMTAVVIESLRQRMSPANAG
jgi:hypothetical protein